MNKITNRSMQRFAFTLIEVLIAVVLTLVLLGLMIRAFSISGSEVSKGRAILETAGQLRATSELLRKDLAGVTARLLANDLGTTNGYFEYIEGISRDDTIHILRNGTDDASGVYGDIDDILMFTARSDDMPFRGRFRWFDAVNNVFVNQTIESNYAEIIWWTVLEDVNGNGTFNVGDNLRLYRRVLLIRPDINPADTTITNFGEFQQFNDLSVRLEAGEIRSNGLADLANRANRFARAGTTFPHEPNYINFQGSDAFVLSNPTALGTANNSEGEDIMLKSIAAFDVKVLDPELKMRVLDNNEFNDDIDDERVGLFPGDVGYFQTTRVTEDRALGGYVDLNFHRSAPANPTLDPHSFAWRPSQPIPNNAAFNWTVDHATYCTWSNHYEADGFDNDGDGIADEGTNGLDDDGANGPDDINERETRPPYPYPLRGIQVTIRIIEPTNKIVRQTSVITNFVPE